MKKRGFTIIELLIVLALIGILVGIGGVSIKKQAESRAMLRVRNEIGDFFRVAAKRSQETGKKYAVKFKSDEKIIEIFRGGNVTDTLKLPNFFEYEIFLIENNIETGTVTSVEKKQDVELTLTSRGNIKSLNTLATDVNGKFTGEENFDIYIFKSDSKANIGGNEIAKYAIRLLTTDEHVDFLHVEEYVPGSESEIKEKEIYPASGETKDVSKIAYWKVVKN